MASKEKICIVCGSGSHREDWQSKQYPACDSHSKEEVNAALAKLTPKQVVPSVPTPPPPASVPSVIK
jgi:hypothetical protein